MDKEPFSEANAKLTEELKNTVKTKGKRKFNYWPEVLFVSFVLIFLLALPTFFILKIFLINVCMVLLCLSIYEYWNRNKKFEQVKEEKIQFLENEIEKIQKRADEIEEQIREKTLQKIKEREEYQRKIAELQKKEAAVVEKQRIIQKKNNLWPILAPQLSSYVVNNFEALNDRDCQRMLAFIEDQQLDKRVVFAEDISEEKLEEIFKNIKLAKPLAEVVTLARDFCRKKESLEQMIYKNHAGVDKKVMDALLDQALKNEKYNRFKSKLHSQKKNLEYTTEVDDYLLAFIEVFGSEARENIDNLVQLVQEEISKDLTRGLIEPLVEQELARI